MHGPSREERLSLETWHGPIRVLGGFSLVVNLLLLILPIHMTLIYDRVVPSRSVETLVYLTLLALGGLALFGFVEAVRGRVAEKTAQRFDLVTTPKLLIDAVDGAGKASPALVRDVGTVRRFLASRAHIGLYDLPFAPIFLILLFLLHPLLGGLTVAGLVGLVGIAVLNQRRIAAVAERSAAEQGDAERAAGEALAAQEDARAMGMGAAMLARWSGAALAAAETAAEASEINNGWFGLGRTVRQSLQVLTLAAAAWLVIGGSISPSLIFVASILSGRALQPIEQLIGSWRMMQEARDAHGRIAAALDAIGLPARRTTLPEPRGVVRLSGVEWSPAPGLVNAPKIVAGVDLTLSPGEITVIVGASGSGKSTLARIVAGAIAPTGGTIALDGFAYGQWPSDQRGAAFGYMAQSLRFFKGTIAQNIARFAPDATDAGVIAAAEAAVAHDFVATLPRAYDTMLGGAEAVRLSGGQVQRIALARALYGSPKVIVLDEPNAHLDQRGEQALAEALAKRRAAGATVLVVTQRPAILEIADRVFVMQAGRLAPAEIRRGSPSPRTSPGDAGARAPIAPSGMAPPPGATGPSPRPFSIVEGAAP